MLSQKTLGIFLRDYGVEARRTVPNPINFANGVHTESKEVLFQGIGIKYLSLFIMSSKIFYLGK